MAIGQDYFQNLPEGWSVTRQREGRVGDVAGSGFVPMRAYELLDPQGNTRTVTSPQDLYNITGYTYRPAPVADTSSLMYLFPAQDYPDQASLQNRYLPPDLSSTTRGLDAQLQSYISGGMSPAAAADKLAPLMQQISQMYPAPPVPQPPVQQPGATGAPPGAAPAYGASTSPLMAALLPQLAQMFGGGAGAGMIPAQGAAPMANAIAGGGSGFLRPQAQTMFPTVPGMYR